MLTSILPRGRTLTVLHLLMVSILSACGCGRTGKDSTRVVLYCAQDQEFAQGVLEDFHRRTGLKVAANYDSEANKSVSLYENLRREASHPRCDVHWNNEILATIRLQKEGLLEPYRSPSAEPYPAAFKASDGTWHAFAARARILLVNTKLVPEAERPKGLQELTQPRWRGKVAIAKPQFGTTATEAACLFQAWGADKAKELYLGLSANGIHVLPGNKQVAEGVGQGQFAVGLTDTDDAMGEVEAGRPVALVYPDRDAAPGSGRGTLFIPNTVAVIRGCPNPQGARQLVDYLLSQEVEGKLAQSGSKQIPLNPQVKVRLPDEIQTPHTVTPLPVNFEAAAGMWKEVQAFLQEKFAQ